LWGILPAVLIQQDALLELHWAIIDQELKPAKIGPSCMILRSFQNLAAGHPTPNDRGRKEKVRKSASRRMGNLPILTAKKISPLKNAKP